MDFTNIIIANGYLPEGYGFKKVTGEYTHWITTFAENEVQLYNYLTTDKDFESTYNTGVITVTEAQLDILIKLFLSKQNYGN
jgi:hypothetical protein